MSSAESGSASTIRCNAYACDVRAERRPAPGAVGGGVGGDEHRQAEVDERRLSLDSPRRRVALVVGAQRVEHARRAASRALHDPEQVHELMEMPSEQIERCEAHLRPLSTTSDESGRNACSTHSASCSLGA